MGVEEDELLLAVEELFEVGNKVVIGAGSVVSRSIPDNSVAVGNPARVVGTYDAFIERRTQEKNEYPCFDFTFTIGNITEDKRDEMLRLIQEYGGRSSEADDSRRAHRRSRNPPTVQDSEAGLQWQLCISPLSTFCFFARER